MGVALLDLMKDDAELDRTFKRYRVNVPLSIASAAGDGSEEVREVLPGLAHNVSLSGLGFVSFGCYEMGNLLDIEITLESQTFVLLATVRRKRQMDLNGDVLYHYGTQFVRTEAALHFIPVAAQFMLTHGADRRTPVLA